MEVELHLEQLAVDLDRAAREARERMQRGNRRGLSTFADEIQHRRWLQDLLREMTSVVDRTARGNGTGKDRRLHVWPGYDSILLAGTRVTFDVEHGIRLMLTDGGYENGVTAEGHERAMQTGVIFPSKENQTDRATLYFDAALASIPGHEADPENTFSVGSTHNWLALSPTVGADPLIGFEARTEKCATTNHRSFPTIDLDPTRPLEWGHTLAAAIRQTCGDSPQSFWPLPTRRRGESQIAYTERLRIEHKLDDHRLIRQKLYSLWLIGCFSPDPASVLLEGRGPGWLDLLISELEELEPERARRTKALRDLERNIASGSAPSFETGHFTTWGVVTIPYPIADTRTGEDGEESDDLGSGMLLSNFSLPYWYYFVIRQWIASYYLSLRQQESSVVRAEREAHKAALHAERELRRQLSHAVGTELTYVEFLAAVAREAIAEEHFNPSAPRLAAGVTHLSEMAHSDFVERFGQPTVLEENLIRIVQETGGTDQLQRDVALIEASLAAVPAGEGRNVIGALANEVARVALENRALVRVDDPAVIAEFERSDELTGDDNAKPLVELLARALVVSLTVYFRKAFPPFGEGPEEVCVQSAEALFGDADNDTAQRRADAQSCARDWRTFVARSYLTNGFPPSYAEIRLWLANEMRRRSRLEMELPDPTDIARLVPGCGEYAPLVIQAWMTEALLNALKHSRSSLPPFTSTIRVDWLREEAILEISNTTTPDRAAEVAVAVDAAARGASTIKEGHQGLAFLGYAAKHLFTGSRLHSEMQRGTHMLHLCVR